MSNQTLYLFFGFEAEYSLSPLAKYMREKGFNVAEISNSETFKRFMAQKPATTDIVLISSWHVYSDKLNFSIYHPHFEGVEMASPLELLNILQPKKAYFYPHDLVDLFVPHEARWFDLFDGVFFPFKTNNYYLLKAITQTYDVGWIKKLHPTSFNSDGDAVKILYFPSNVNTDVTPSEHVDSYFDIYKECSAIKFPVWTALNPYMQSCKDAGLPIIESTKTIFELLDDYDLIMTNSNSSVITEAGLSGKPVATFYDKNIAATHLVEEIPRQKWLTKLPYEEVVPFMQNVKAKKIPLNSYEDILKPFDFEGAVKIITG